MDVMGGQKLALLLLHKETDMSGTVAVVIYTVNGHFDDVKVFPVTRIAKEHVEHCLRESGDESNWHSEVTDEYISYTHKALENERIDIVIKHIEEA